MKIINKKIDELIPYAKNTKKHDQVQINNVAESIRQYGFVQPIVIDRDGVVVIGHCRLLGAKKLKMKEVPCVCVDDLTPEQVNALRIVDNKTNESDWDLDFLNDELNDIDLTMFDFDFDLSGVDITSLGDDEAESYPEPKSLSDRFIVPPYSVLDARQGYWADRKKAWNKMIGDNGEARDNVNAYINDCFDPKKYKVVIKNNGTSVLDPVLSEVMCRWFLPNESGNKTFDVFAGDTVFGYVSSRMGNEFTGIELRKKQVDFNTKHTEGLNAKYICDDGRNVLKHVDEASQDLLFSCPPYYDIEVYSDNENDASNQKTYEDFYKIIDEAFSNAIKCLKNNRFAVIVCGDIRSKKDGSYYTFPDDIKRTFISNGMVLYDDLVLLDPIGNAGMKAGRFMHNRKVCKVHQNVLVFYKGDTSKIKQEFKELGEYEGKNLEF